MAARPEDISVVSAGDDDIRLVADIELIEMRGSTAYFICDMDGTELTVLREGDEGLASGWPG